MILKGPLVRLLETFQSHTRREAIDVTGDNICRLSGVIQRLHYTVRSMMEFRNACRDFPPLQTHFMHVLPRSLTMIDVVALGL